MSTSKFKDEVKSWKNADQWNKISFDILIGSYLG